MNAEIKRLEALEKEQTDALHETRDKLRLAREAMAGVKVGDIVQAKSGRWKGQRFRVVRLEMVDWKPRWIVANPARKNGSFGTAERNLFSDWELVT